MFLAGGLEVLPDRPLECCLVLPDEAGHAVELFDPPSIAPRHARREVALLPSNRSWNGFMVVAPHVAG